MLVIAFVVDVASSICPLAIMFLVGALTTRIGVNSGHDMSYTISTWAAGIVGYSLFLFFGGLMIWRVLCWAVDGEQNSYVSQDFIVRSVALGAIGGIVGSIIRAVLWLIGA